MRTQSKVVTSACVVIPPQKLWNQIQQIRSLYDKSFERWPPHINLIYPFIPESLFETYLNDMRSLLSCVIPFPVRCEVFQFWQQRQSFTLYLEPTTMVLN
jgi:hypothetical protein